MTSPIMSAYQQAYLEACAERGVEPGKCFCRCNADVRPSERNYLALGIVKGDNFRFIRGHQRRLHPLEYEVRDAGWTSPCWIWLRGTSKCGHGFRYGLTRKAGTNICTQAHREVWERHRGPIPDGLELDHLCPNTLCVNPWHLDPKTHEGNVQVGKGAKLSEDQVAEIRELCKNGELQRVIAEMYGVHSAHISKICSGKKWKSQFAVTEKAPRKEVLRNSP